MSMLSPIASVGDRALVGHCLFDFHNHLPWILHRHDRMGMASSLEMRVPFLENGMIDLASHFPRRAKLYRGQTKWVVKTAAEARLPRKIVHARKKGFPIPESFSSGTERLLAGGLLAEQMEWAARTADEIINLAATASNVRFRLVGLELWLRIFLDGADLEELGEQLMALAD